MFPLNAGKLSSVFLIEQTDPCKASVFSLSCWCPPRCVGVGARVLAPASRVLEWPRPPQALDAGVGGPSLGHWWSEMWLRRQRTRRVGSGSVGGPASWLSSVRLPGVSMQFLEGLMGSSLRNRIQNPARVTWSELCSESQKAVCLWRCRGSRDPEWRSLPLSRGRLAAQSGAVLRDAGGSGVPPTWALEEPRCLGQPLLPLCAPPPPVQQGFLVALTNPACPNPLSPLLCCLLCGAAISSCCLTVCSSRLPHREL